MTHIEWHSPNHVVTTMMKHLQATTFVSCLALSNLAMGNILTGARLPESEYETPQTTSSASGGNE